MTEWELYQSLAALERRRQLLYTLKGGALQAAVLWTAPTSVLSSPVAGGAPGNPTLTLATLRRRAFVTVCGSGNRYLPLSNEEAAAASKGAMDKDPLRLSVTFLYPDSLPSLAATPTNPNPNPLPRQPPFFSSHAHFRCLRRRRRRRLAVVGREG